ncbi:MAG: hypothetical protein HYT37_02710 [Candidatus Sungbacteria bacterium]|nr:hypothetical protein [Candidatus Sungbacteria bacterium]
MQSRYEKEFCNYLVLGIILFALIVGAAFWYATLNGKTYTVELREDGFYPKELTIQKGDTVVFTTTREKPFWPASNVHPSHQIYPEFDPKTPIEPHSKWKFSFDKAGEWRYHDHLASQYTGLIIAGGKEKLPVQNAEECKKRENKWQCWEDLLGAVLQAQGLNRALEIFSELYTTEPDFAVNCHGFTHKLGEAAYFIFAEHKDIEVGPKTYYCGYGFYHGFMEALLQKTGNIEEARAFCTHVGKKLERETAFAEGACYHGIGHGAVDGGDPRAWGDPQAMIEPALNLCTHAGSTENQIYLCGTGVFNSLAVLFGDPKYKLHVDEENTYIVCEKQSNPLFKRACYEQMNTLIVSVKNGDFKKVIQVMAGITDDEYARYAIESAAAHFATTVTAGDYEKMILLCRDAQPRLRSSCMHGFVGGVLEHGSPEEEYKKTLTLCRSKKFSEAERNNCFKSLFAYLNMQYPRIKVSNICESEVEGQYKIHCQ